VRVRTGRAGAAAALSAMVIAIASLAGCSSTDTPEPEAGTLKADEVEAAITDGLQAQFPKKDFAVTCPAGVVAETGGVFTCDVTVGSEGSIAVVTVTQSDDQGSITWAVTEVVEVGASAEPAASPSG